MDRFLGLFRKSDPSASLGSDRVLESTSQHDRRPRKHGKRNFLRVPGSSSQRKRSSSTSRSKNERSDASRQDASTPTPTPPTQPHDAPDTEDIGHWGKAYNIAKKKLNADEQLRFGPQFELSPRECIQTALEEAEKARNDRDKQKWTYRNSAGELVSLRDRFDRIVEGIDKYAKAVDIAVNHSPEITSLVWASARFLLQVYLNHKESIEALEKALSTIITTMANCEFYSGIYANSLRSESAHLRDRLEAALPEFYAAVLVFSVKAKHYFAPPPSKRFTRPLKPFSAEILPHLDEIEKKELQLKTLALMATMEGVQDVRSAQFRQLAGEFKQMRIPEEHLQALTWLEATHPETSRKIHLARRLPGTCHWITEHKGYKSWAQDTGKGHLWIEGIPGAGKSVLAANMVLELQKINDVVLYYFFRDDDAATTSASEMMASLVAQLIDASSGSEKRRLMEIMCFSCRSNFLFSKTKRPRDFENLRSLFTQMLQGYPGRVIVLLDALDECTDSSLVSNFLQLPGNYQPSDVRFFLTGRPVVGHLFRTIPSVATIEMNATADIALFITQKVEDNESLLPHRDRIIATVNENSEGMFRYAALVLEELEIPSSEKVSDRLRAMPKGISGMYELMLRRLGSNGSEKELVMRKRILLWIATAYAPIKVSWMQAVCAAVDGDKSFNLNDVILPTTRQMLTACGSLVAVFKGWNVDDALRFTHRTVKEFLLQPKEKLSQDSINNPHVTSCLVDNQTAHASLALTCVTLTFSKQSGSERSSHLEYPWAFWYSHAQCVPFGRHATPLSEELWGLVRDHLWRHTKYRNEDPLIFATNFGFKDVIDWAHPPGIDFNVRDSEGMTPLLLAILSPHLDAMGPSPQTRRQMVESLLNNGADVNAKNPSGETALTIGTRENDLDEAVSILIARTDCELDHVTNDGCSALGYAREHGNARIVELLHERGARVALVDGKEVPWPIRSN